MNNVRVFLAQPYPFLHQGKLLWRNALLIFCIGFFFDYFFEPYNVYRPEHKWPYAIIVATHALNGSLQFLLFGSLLSRWVSTDDWKLRKEFLYLGSLMLTIGIGSFLLRDFIYDNADNWSLRYLLEEVRNTILSGSLILFFVTYINFRLLRAEHQAGAVQVMAHRQEPDPSEVQLQTPLHSENIAFRIDELILAKAEGNYVRFYLKSHGEIREEFIRISLSSVAEQLHDFQQIIKTHRAFLFNLHHLDQVEGNAQGYYLSIPSLDFQVPVSRSQLAHFNERLSQAS